MYIKQVIIEGFKSYKEQVATEPFSSKHNCVVGANGSGKTNFFHAIRFVLSDLFHNLRAEDRQALLHEGAGHQVMSAFVEIVFDNSDNRIPVDREEVRLRRTIGVKKDEYFLDKKHITKTEVMNLLESAGFSRSNPYYVVQQGKIASLTLMKDHERLDLLKEIGGTRVYEERRKESLKIMVDTENRRKQIIEVVQYIEERLKELDEEKEELKKYQQLDKQRRSLQYTIFEKELLDARQKLEEIEESRARVSEKSSEMHNTVVEAHEKSKNLEKELKTLNKELQSLMKEKEAAERQKTEALSFYARKELDVKDVEERMRAEARTQVEVQRELKAIEKEVEKSRKDLEEVSAVYDQLLSQEETILKGIADRERQLSILYQKQGRTTQFQSRQDRDSWLQKEIDDYERVMADVIEQIAKLELETNNLNEEYARLKRSAEARKAEMNEQEAIAVKCRRDFEALTIERGELQDVRKVLWKKEGELNREVEKLKADIVKAEKSMDLAAPGDIRRGLQSIRRIIKDHNITGVHGPLAELLECEEKFFTALEVTAGNRYQKKTLKELHKMLHKCNEQLKNYSHVNKKALDQYVNFTEQREELHKRQAELDSGDEKIRELISVLDQRKDESIERTFKGVAKFFKEAFSELVPGGHGSLVMMTKRKADEVGEEDPDEEGAPNGEEARREKYVGVKVKVSFTGQGETQSMKQLSGGQKTVVALTLIFAIQRCDPAPFY